MNNAPTNFDLSIVSVFIKVLRNPTYSGTYFGFVSPSFDLCGANSEFKAHETLSRRQQEPHLKRKGAV